jgi:hypothetical protein
MHKDLLERCTGYFQKEKLFDTVAAEKKLIFLDDEDPDALGMFRTWAYTGLLPFRNRKPPTAVH